MSPSRRAFPLNSPVLRQAVAFVCASAPPFVGFLALAWHYAFVRFVITTVEPYLLMAIQVAAVSGMVWTVVGSRGGWRVTPAWAATATRDKAVWYGLLLGVCLILFACPLISAWTRPGPPMYLIGGMLPYNDGLSYYEGALLQLFSGKVDAWNSRRPINALLYAVRLACAGDDFRLALVVQGVLLGTAAYLFAVTVARDCGRAGGLVALGVAFAFGRVVVASPASEPLGLTLGLLASTVLWRGARDHRLGLFTMGLFAMTVALNARAGAFLALPALVVWAGIAFRGPGRRVNWRAVCVTAGAVVAGFGMQVLLRAIYGVGAGFGQGNFWLTFYGIATGHPDWTQIYRDYPRTRTMADPALNSFARARAFELLWQNPFGLVQGVVLGFWLWMRDLPSMIERLLGLGVRPVMPVAVRCCVLSLAAVVAGGAVWAERRTLKPFGVLASVVGLAILLGTLGTLASANGLAAWFLATGGIAALWRARRDARTWMILAHAAAVMASAAIVYRDAGFRVLIVSYPLFFLPASMAASGWRGSHATRGRSDEPPDRGECGRLLPAYVALGMALLLFLAALVGPQVAYWRESTRLVASAPTGAGTGSLVVRLGPGAAYLKILAPGSPTPTFTPVIRDEDWAHVDRRADPQPWGPTGDRFRGPLTIGMLLNLRRDDTRAYFVVGPPNLIGDKWETVELFGKRVPAKDFTYFFVERVRPWRGEARP